MKISQQKNNNSISNNRAYTVNKKHVKFLGSPLPWCWVNFQCWGVLLIWSRVGQGPITLAVGAGGDVWTFFSLIYHFSFLSPSLWEMARYRLKYCLKGPLKPKQPTNPPTNEIFNRVNKSIVRHKFQVERFRLSPSN